MGDFDDVLAMGPGDDWDDWDTYAAGEDPRPLVELAPLAMELRLPHATVSLHGDLPEPVRDALIDLTNAAEGPATAASAVQLSIDGAHGVHSVVDVERGVLLEGASEPELLDGLLEELVRIAVRSAPQAVHLEGAAVELGVGRDSWGILLVGPEPLRLEAVDALRASGATVLGERVVSLLSGSRTITALPLPGRLQGGWSALSGRAALGTHTVPDRVVVLDPLGDRSAGPMSPADATVGLLAARCGGGLTLPDALDVVATTVASASTHRAGSAVAAVAVCLEAPPRPRRPAELGLRSDGTVSPTKRWARLDDRVLEADGGHVEQLPPGAAMPPLGNDATDDRIGGWGSTATSADGVDAAAIDAVLVEVCGRLVAAGSIPIVLGAAVLAHDGPWPAEVVEVPAVELLVPRDRLHDLVELLVEDGHVATLDPAADAVSGPAVRLRARGSGVPVLLYDRLAAGPFGELVDHEEFHARSVPIRVAGHWLRALHPEDRFVLACVRLAMAPEATPALVQHVELSAPRATVLTASALEASERWGATRSTLAAVRAANRAGAGMSAWLVDRARRGDGPNVPGVPSRRERRRRRGRRA